MATQEPQAAATDTTYAVLFERLVSGRGNRAREKETERGGSGGGRKSGKRGEEGVKRGERKGRKRQGRDE